MGWVLLGGYCGEALLQRLRGQPPKDEKTLWGASLLAILASGLNPSDFNVIPGMFAYQHSTLQRSLKEWHASGLWPPSWYSGLLLGAAGVLLWARRRVRTSDVLLFAVFAGLSLMAQRNVIFIGLIAPIAIASYLPQWQRPLPLGQVARDRDGSNQADEDHVALRHQRKPREHREQQHVAGPHAAPCPEQYARRAQQQAAVPTRRPKPRRMPFL